MTTLTLPDLSGQPLDALKQWLAISTPGEDALLLRLLASAWQACVHFTGTTAADWSELDEALRHGLIRFAAHQYRERDGGGGAPSLPQLPPCGARFAWCGYELRRTGPAPRHARCDTRRRARGNAPA